MSSYPKKPLTSILAGGAGGNNNDIFDQFDTIEAADDFGPLPRGVYTAVAVGGQKGKAQTGTECYTIEFRVIEGEYASRRLWLSKYFTEAALPHTKRELSKFGIDSKAKLNRPFPADRFVCRLTVVLRKDDAGIERNEIRNVEVIRVQEPQADPYAPTATPADERDGDPDFPFSANGGPSP